MIEEKMKRMWAKAFKADDDAAAQKVKDAATALRRDNYNEAQVQAHTAAAKAERDLNAAAAKKVEDDAAANKIAHEEGNAAKKAAEVWATAAAAKRAWCAALMAASDASAAKQAKDYCAANEDDASKGSEGDKKNEAAAQKLAMKKAEDDAAANEVDAGKGSESDDQLQDAAKKSPMKKVMKAMKKLTKSDARKTYHTKWQRYKRELQQQMALWQAVKSRHG